MWKEYIVTLPHGRKMLFWKDPQEASNCKWTGELGTIRQNFAYPCVCFGFGTMNTLPGQKPDK